MFITDMDHSLRELGIGDAGVPKRMKKLSKMFYGRAEFYGKALDEVDAAELAAALLRNVRPDTAEWPQADDLARYLISAEAALKKLDDTLIARGEIPFLAATKGEAS